MRGGVRFGGRVEDGSGEGDDFFEGGEGGVEGEFVRGKPDGEEDLGAGVLDL